MMTDNKPNPNCKACGGGGVVPVGGTSMEPVLGPCDCTKTCEITGETNSISVRDYFEDIRWSATALWLATAWGPKRVTYISGHEHSDPWVVTGRDLNQQSFAVHYGVLLYLSAQDAQESRT